MYIQLLWYQFGHDIGKTIFLVTKLNKYSPFRNDERKVKYVFTLLRFKNLKWFSHLVKPSRGRLNLIQSSSFYTIFINLCLDKTKE